METSSLKRKEHGTSYDVQRAERPGEEAPFSFREPKAWAKESAGLLCSGPGEEGERSSGFSLFCPSGMVLLLLGKERARQHHAHSSVLSSLQEDEESQSVFTPNKVPQTGAWELLSQALLPGPAGSWSCRKVPQLSPRSLVLSQRSLQLP